MAIPGLKANYEVRAKVRIGEKRKAKNGKEFPASVDYFICDDPEFQVLVGEKAKVLRIRLPFESAADNFSTGLEFWRGKQLTCYSKGETSPAGETLAYRVNGMLDGFRVIGEPMGRGKERTPVACAFRACPNFKTKDCRPMGRLQFFLDEGRTDAVLQLDTKSWNTIEGVEAVLGAAAAKGDLRGRVFLLSVAIEQKANQKFPVVSLKEAPVVIETDADVTRADALVAAAGSLERAEEPRVVLARLLDVTNPTWRDNPAFIARVKEVGPDAALKKMLEQLDA